MGLHANFITVKVGPHADDIVQYLLKKGIIVRRMKSYDLPEWIRVSVGTPEQNERFFGSSERSLDKVWGEVCMKMAVIGCGLIGGSMALSWKRAGIVDEVIAFGHNPATLQKALDKGAADAVTTSMEEAVKDADIVVSAVPVEAMESVFY